MTINLSANRYRTRPAAPREPLELPQSKVHAKPAQAPSDPDMLFAPAADDDGFGPGKFATAGNGAEAPPSDDIDGIRREGLTGRELRAARRLAQRHGLPATSDFDAVRLLRQAGIDPFQKSVVMEVMAGEAAGEAPGQDDAPGGEGSRALARSPEPATRLPQTIKPIKAPSIELRAEQTHISEVARMQKDIAQRRRQRLGLLMARMGIFVLLPTFLAGWYYYVIATPMYTAKTEFQIQTADPAASAGLSGMLSASPLGGAKDSVAVQGFLQSQEAMQLLDADVGLRADFSDPGIDTLQRLAPDATNSALYALYKDHVRISFDPTEGIVKMEVSTADPQRSVDYSKALLTYAEQQVDQMSERLRDDQMEGAAQSYEQAEQKLAVANQRVVELQEKFKVLSSEVEVGLLTTQIGALETQLTQDRLSLAQMQSNANPNQARMDPLIQRIATLEGEIVTLRAKLTEDGQDGQSLARVQSELLVAQADVATRQMMAAAALQAMETARIEATRQNRYLTISTNPVAPDEPTYPRAFEDTLVVLLIFLGIYLMISMTVAILREQVTT